MKKNKFYLLLTLSLLGITISSCKDSIPSASSDNFQSEASNSESVNSSSSNEESSSSENTSSSEHISSSIEDSSSEDSSSSEDEKLVDGYRLVTNISELENAKKVVIGAYDSNKLYGFTSTNKTNGTKTYPWYFVGEAINEANEHKDIKDLTNTAIWDLSKVGSSYKFSVNGKDLYSYIDGSHYSIGLDNNKDGTEWNITIDETGKAQAVSSKNVYLQYYLNSFCGTSKSHKDSAYVYFYVPSKISYVETPKDPTGDIDLPGTTDDKYWEGLNFNTYGNTFRGALQQLIKNYKTQSISYSQCKEVGIKAATYPEGSNTFIPFYHASDEVTEGITKNGVYLANEYTDSINREHTWPNSRGCGENSGPGCDPFVIRPTLTNDNSGRGNLLYGTVAGTWDPASYGYEGARGEAARIMFYTATAYFNTCGTGGSSKGNAPLELTNNPSDGTINHTMGVLSELLEWNMKYPVTNMEKQINNYLASHGYGRNPFVDHPEYANQIWDKEGIRTTAPDGSEIPSTPDEPSLDIPTLTPNGETVEILKAGAFSFGSQQYVEIDQFDYSGITVKMLSGATKTKYVRDNEEIRVYTNGGIDLTNTNSKIAYVEITYKNCPNKNDKRINSLTFSAWGKDSPLELKDGEYVTVKMDVNGVNFSLKAVGEAGYVAFSSIKCYLAD